RVNDTLLPFYNEPGAPDWRFSNMLHTAFSDRQGNLWLSTRSHGLEKAVFNRNSFQIMTFDSELHSTVNNDIRAIFEDREQNVWVSSKGGKIYVMDKNNNIKGYICNDGKIACGTALPGIAYCMTQDKKGNIWIGTKGEGVFKLSRKDGAESYRITHFKSEPDNVYSLSDNNIYSIFEDKNGCIWIGSYGAGLNLYDETKGRFINHRNHLKQYPIQTGSQIRIISSDKNGNVFIGTTIGLIVFSPDFDTPEKIDFNTYMRIPGENTSISGNDIFDICTTKSGDTYIATFGGGLNKLVKTGKKGFPLHFKSYTTQNGLPSDIILALVEDESGMIWICSENNLTKFDAQKETFDTFSEIKRLIKGQIFSEGSRCASRSGEDIMFGFSRGVIQFKSQQVKNYTFKPYVALSGFRLFNKAVTVGGNSPLTCNIDNVDRLVLKRDQNFFTIDFVALDYIDPQNIYYAYMLEGFDKDWIYSQNQRSANYTNLSKGEYVFMIKSTNSDGVWMDNSRSLTIIIRPSFWETPWAYLIYLFFFVAFIYMILRVLFIYYRMKDRVELEQEQAEMRARFFTDISHEIRTPLTMIVSPVENLLYDKETPSEVKKQLELVSKNTSRMLKMVNQILDFRKIQQQELNVEETNIGSFVADICSGFAKTAETRGIHFTVENRTGDDRIWIDQNCVEKIIVNLLSNAFKYTPDNKAVSVSVYHDRSGGIAVEVKDEGVGVSKEKQSKLFNRFVSFNEDKNKPSTGIGLSMVKELADKHHAKIYVESEEKKGSSFTVVFQRGLAHFGEKVSIIPKHEKTEESEGVAEETIAAETAETVTSNGKPVVLIVEDDEDLRSFIRSILENDYIVHEAGDGEEGYEKITSILPDLIVSDIMMPNVDGIELLQKVRENITVSHTLFLLLTAKTTIDSQLEGLENGADEYLTKPFSVPYFRTKIKTMLERRGMLQNYYQRIIHSGVPAAYPDFAPSRPEITSRDEELMKTVIEIIEKNIDNSDFVVENIASELGMSRTVFYKKIKSLTGLAPIEFIRDIVIQRAAQLLESGLYSVKEIAYTVGMSDSKYFSKCFKKKYGVTPSEYKKKFEAESQV
ncbi:MAG: response regulator, partial [Prevotellaceae bacterium]|nr:response regulator [Prevotellaceae bacterium]